jgi:tetratricopeptide (TPR) repeat protein
MTALATLLDGYYNGTVPPEAVILTHEERYWRRTAMEHGLNLTRDTLRCGVTAAALCGAANQAQAVAILSHVPGLHDRTEDVRLRAAYWLRDLYQPLADPPRSEPGPERYWGSLQPDLLAEHLAASVVDARPDFLPRLLSDCTPEQGQQALTVLARAAGSRPGMAAPLTDLLAQLPDLAPAAVIGSARSGHPAPLITALTALVDSHRLPASLLSAVFDVIPEQTRALNGLAIAISRYLVATFERLAKASPDTYLADVAVWQTNLSVRLADAGQQEKALAAIERAVTIYERLAEATPDAYLPRLASSLDNLSVLLSKVGRQEKGLAVSRRTVAIWEQLAGASPNTYLPNLAAALSNLSNRLGSAGQRQDGLAAGQRATGIYEQLAKARPDAYLPSLAKSLANLSGWLGDAGRMTEALAAIQRAVTIRRKLAERYPEAFEPDLALSLVALADRLVAAGEYVAAMESLINAAGLAERRNRQDLVSLVAQRLRQEHHSQPAVVAAEYERLTGGPWPS